jgi:AcrR family transcriptional regulator
MNIPAKQRAAKKAKRATAADLALVTDDNRQRILTAALKAFAERGFHGTAIPEIASEAGVGVASIYRRFVSKERLVNEVFRDAKSRLRDALLLDLDLGGAPRAMFLAVWARLVRFARAEPLAFQFLEMQDHVPYLDGESRALEASLLLPILVATEAATGKSARGVPPRVLIAMVWGAFVGITKAARLGYLALDEATLLRAGEASWALVATTLPHRGE